MRQLVDPAEKPPMVRSIPGKAIIDQKSGPVLYKKTNQTAAPGRASPLASKWDSKGLSLPLAAGALFCLRPPAAGGLFRLLIPYVAILFKYSATVSWSMVRVGPLSVVTNLGEALGSNS